MPRWYGTFAGHVSLHILCDASVNAVAAVAYVVQNGHSSLCLAKSKVSLLKRKSIPRLELEAAVLGIRLLKLIKQAEPFKSIEEVFLWRDAQDVRYWLRSTQGRYNIFVANRVTPILSETKKEQWRWVPSLLNLADLATKCGKRPEGDELWNSGPEFIRKDKSRWPDSFQAPDEVQELRTVGVIQTSSHEPMLDVTRFSKWLVLIRTAATILSTLDVMRKLRKPGPLTAEMDGKEKN